MGAKEPVGQTTSQGETDEDASEDSEEEVPQETDEERARREEAEVAEQNILIEYNNVTGKYKRFRPDYKCGNRVPPLPDEKYVECDPDSLAPCCSENGWCGYHPAHCKCGACINYRKVYNRTTGSSGLYEVIGMWTQSTHGCPCYWDSKQTSCACCEDGGCPCEDPNRHSCRECGEHYCSLGDVCTMVPAPVNCTKYTPNSGSLVSSVLR